VPPIPPHDAPAVLIVDFCAELSGAEAAPVSMPRKPGRRPIPFGLAPKLLQHLPD
jgi:hypothetical protein